VPFVGYPHRSTRRPRDRVHGSCRRQPVDDPALSFPAVRAIDVETGRIRDLPVGNIRLGRGLSLSPDGRWLLQSQNDRAQTLVMIAK